MWPVLAVVLFALSDVSVTVVNEAGCAVRVQPVQQGTQLGRPITVAASGSRDAVVRSVRGELALGFRVIPTDGCVFKAYDVPALNNLAGPGATTVEVRVAAVPNNTMVRGR